ncbi:MAG: DeoR/GlpR family DNA-binding transcription regulator [Rhodobacterales bacterium]
MQPHPNHRQQEILDILHKLGGSARVHSIAQTLGVSEETVRRNIKRLEKTGTVEKLHGGVRIVGNAEETSFQQRLNENPEAKLRIAHKVAQMIPNGSSLFLDIGSTTAFIADALRDHQNLLVVTNSVAVAYKLATRNNNRVFMAGGELRSHDGGAFGIDAMNFADNFQTDFAVLSAAGINAANGFMLFDLEEAKFSRLIMSKSATRIIAADARKFNRVAPVTIGNPDLVDYLVCDAPPPEDIADACKLWNTEITLDD